MVMMTIWKVMRWSVSMCVIGDDDDDNSDDDDREGDEVDCMYMCDR